MMDFRECCNCKLAFTFGGIQMNIEFPTIDVKATGARIKELRKERGLTIREVSEYMGFTTDQAVCKWQRGDSLPTVDNLYALSRLYGTTMEDILVGDDEMSSHFYMNPMFYQYKREWFILDLLNLWCIVMILSV